MRTNVLNDLSNVVKKGTSLACSWSQVGRMSEGAPDEHPMSIRSASDGERWKPAGEKGSTRVWKHVACILCVLMLGVGQMWGVTKSATQFTASQSGTTYTVSAKSGYGDLSGLTVTTVGASGGVTSNRLKVPAGTFNIATSDGTTPITAITITWRNSSSQYPTSNSECTVNTGTATTSSQTTTWSGSATSVSFTNTTANTFQVVGLSVTYGASYYYRGQDNSWGATAMTISAGGTYEYIASSNNTHQFKIATSSDSWDYNYTYVDAGFYGTSSDIGDYSSDNCYIWMSGSYYIVVFKPNTAINTTNNPKICASATKPQDQFTISFDNGGGSGTMSSITSINAGENKTTTANTFTKAGYRFAGWKANVDVKVGGSTKTAGTVLADGVTIQNILSDITLTAQWEERSCPVSGTVYSLTMKSATLSGVTQNTEVALATTYATDEGGTSYLGNLNATAGKAQVSTEGSGTVYFNGNDAYIKIVLDCPIQTGDELTFTNGSGSRQICITTSTTRATTYTTSSNSYTFPAAFNNVSTIYVWRSSSNGTYLHSLTITRTASCGATQPGEIGKGSLSNCSITLTAANSPAANNTWYWQSASDGTATNLGSGATKSVSTPGTYYIRSYFSTGSCWSDARSVTVTEGDLTPAAPTALASSSPTAKGVTLTVTDTPNTNDYDFYVSTSSSAPDGSTPATYTSTSKTLTITDLYAGTTFYAWVRAKCGSYKSAWTALTGSTFTTSTVSADYHLSNVTKTSGATSGIGGSTFTAVFAAVSGYSLPSPVVTIGGNSATSGTDYTWTAGTGTLTINANKINGDIDITMSSPASAPTNVAISGAYHYYPGETISLTATATGGNGPKTYQWYHGGTADGDAIDGATSATFSKTCVVGDAGSYYCKVTCGGSASTWSDGAGHDPYNVKIMQFVLKNNSSVEISRTALTKVDATHATVILHLTGGTTYKFRITDGCGNYFGNTGTMTNGNSTDWYMNADADCGMTTGLKTSNYTFNVTLGDLGNGMQVTAIYPGGDQAAGKIIYWDNSVLNWADGAQWYRIGKSTHHNKIQMTKVSGTANLYKVTTIEYNGFEYWHIANNQGNGDGNLFWTKGDAAKAITNAMEFEGAPVTLDAITVTPTNSHETGVTSDNDNCEFYTHTTVSGMKRDRVTITAPVNGTITINYTSEEDVASSFSATTVDMYQDLAHTVILTSITATPNTGYDAGAITINGGAYSANYVVTGATTIAATFSPHTYSITYKDQGDVAFSGTHVDSPNAHPTTHTYATATTLNSATKTGYTFGGWFTNSACTGEAVASLGATAFSADITLYAKWTVNNYNLTWNLGGGTTTSAGTGIASGVSSNTTSSVAYGTSLSAPTVTKTGYNFSAWSPAVASTMPAANTAYTATWTLKTTTITIDANTSNHGSTTPGSVTATYGSALPSFTAASGASGYSLTGYFTAATGGNKIINADGTLVASTSYADGSGNWNSEAATLTLYAQYEEEVSCPSSGTLYSAAVKSSVSSNQSFAANATTEVNTSTQADITGGKLYAINGESSAKNLIANSSGYKFCMTNNSTRFKIEMDCALQEGDIITIDGVGGTKNDAPMGLWVSSSESRPGSAPACVGTSTTTSLVDDLVNYTVTSSDEYHGKTILYIHRAVGSSTYFNNINISRPLACSTPASPSGLTNGATTANTQVVTWTANGEDTWEVYYSTSSSTPGTDQTPTATVTSATYTFTGLTASTTYYWWARSKCDDTHKSAWVAGSSFTTSAAETPIITWEMKLTSGQNWGLNGDPSTTDNTNITSISANNTHAAQLDGKTANGTMTAGCTTAQNGTARDNNIYVEFKFHVGCDKKLTPSKISLQVSNIGGSSDGNMTYDAILTDGTRTVSGSVTPASDGTLTTLEFTNADASKYMQGDVTLRVYPYNNNGGNTGSGFRMGQYVKIFGEIANQATPAATITWNTQPANGQVGDPDFAYAVSCSDGSAVTVTSANTTYATIVGGKLHYAAAGTTHLVATATDACGNTVTPVNSNDFTVSAAAPTHDVTFSLTNVVYSSGNNQGTGAATEGSAFSTVFAASSGYSLPGTITVTIGGVAQTAGTGYTWAQGSGTLTIPAAYVTGDIVVTIVGEEMEGDGCDELVHTEAATATSLSTSVGTATLYNPSSQSKNSKAIKLNSSGYIELSPKAGKSFATGDSLIVVVYNQATSGKTTGFKIGTDTYTASIAASSNHTFRQKLTADNIVSSKVKIERESSDGWFVSAIIKHCEDLPSCTTPTLPSLSDQELCPGSDIAAWDATPTNIATITGASEDVAYSWKKKGSDTELAATASFDLGSSATEGMAGTYVVTVTVSKTGYITKSASAEVDLTVTPATETPVVTASKAKVYAGDEVVFSATCGSTGVTWQWYRCTNAGGTITGSCLSTTSSYTLASAPAAGTYYYKAVATGDGTHSCGTAEYVYTLVVSAANSCDKEFWFAKEGDRPTGAAAATHITGCPSGSSSASYTASIDGTNYTLTGSTGQKTGNVTIVVPADNTGTLYVVVQGSSSRTITLSKGGTQIGQETPENSTWGVFTFDNLDAGTYNLVSSGNISWAMMALKLCPTAACTDDTPTATATNATVCAGGSITITATGYEAGATFQWQKQNASTSVWEDIDDATSATYTVATAAAEHAGNYHIVATKGCARTSNTVTIAVPSAPVFNSFTTTRRVMETQALSISDVSATDAVSYTWYKSSDATWDAGDTEIGDSRSLLKPYDGETAGSTYYVFCRAANSCGTTTSSTITVTVQTLVEEDCAIVGNSGEHNTFAKTGNVSSGTYGSITELHTNSNNKYIYYTAESGYYFAKATVNACVGNASDLPTAAYSYSTDGGANWTDQNLTGMTAAYADHVINLPANVNAFRVGRRLGDCGTSSNTIYIHQVCFEYNENCTKTTVNPSSAAVDYEIGDPFTAPTFTVKHNNVALSPQPTITYTSSDETVATVDDDGTVNFQDKAGTVVITAAYAGDATYCESEGSYTITVSCSDEAPKIIAADGTNIGGCNDNITLEAKKQDGTTNFSDGTYQWYRDGEAISGATDRTYTVSLTGVYSVERTSVGGCVSPSSNKATVTSESAEPEVERLTPFQYYHVDKVYAETSIMRFRHLFAVKNAGTTLEGKHFKMELSRNGGAATDVTNSNAFVMSADTVLLDLNKMGDGKYEEDDELVLTCSAVDCEGNVSSIYKNTITIYVIDETPTLALICSGASGDGTRKTSNLVVGGDFLTGYNKADLCVQTGNTSFDKTQEWVLYTRLKENYIVTPVNGYAEFNKLNYEPFDILFLTDYPKASKSDAAATILDDMADLCDYRPLFTFKTHMVHKSPSKWAAKGFMAQPEVPKQSRLRLNIVCYAHPMFDDLKEVSDHIQKDASDHSQIVYTMLTGPGHEGNKGMQGFPIDAAEGFVTIGLVHYDATAADDTPSEGYVTWTSGSSDVMMVAAAERQVNLEARMILFSINCGAQSKLTETGRQVVLKSLEYLLSDATITPVADCSFTFTNGAGNDWTYEQYKAKCPACTGTIGDGKWSTAGNWGPDWILQPGKDTEVKIAAPVTVDMPHAKVRTVRILEGGSIDIPAGSGLEVGSTIRRLDGTELSPTEVVDLSIGSTSSGNGTLIFNNNAGDTKAGVAMYSKGFIDYTDPSKPKGIKNYQYIGVPCVNINAAYNYYGSWIYSWSDKGGSYGWQKVVNGGIVTTWTGYCITQESAGTYYAISGTLAATNTVDIDVPAGENMVVGNSWTAPIYIKEFTDDDFENLLGNVYFFNTGVDQDYTSGHEQDLGDRYASSTYVTVPIHSSPYTGDSLISSMQGFFVKSNGSAGALHLDYDRHVRPSTNRNILSGVMHAPRRANAQSDEPAVLKIKVSGENYDDKLLLLAREDFSMGFDNGWDGDKWDGNESALYIYTKDEAGTENSVSAIPEMEGTVIGFRAGEDDAYTLHFEYLNSAEELYLFDTETNAYTKIMTGATYRFFTEDKEKHERFIITRKSPQIATDVDEVDSGKRREVRKLLIEDKMYILVNGMLYDATGKVVK